MLSDQVLVELTRDSPLRSHLLKVAWPALSTESKLQLIDAVCASAGIPHTPAEIGSLALKDPAPIVRYWAARYYHFERPRLNRDDEFLGISQPTTEELSITARADADDCAIVQAAAKHGGFALDDMTDLPQLARLVELRRASYPTAEAFARFIETAVSTGGASVEEVRDCIWEYFAREDVRHELDERDDDGFTEYSKTRGYELLWTIASTAPFRIAVLIANRAALQGRFWKIEAPQLLALPDAIKQVVVRRDEEPAEQLRQTIKSSSDKYNKELVDAVDGHYKIQADPSYRDYSADEREEFRLEHMANRQHAVFLSVKKVRNEVSLLRDAFAEPPKLSDLNKAVQQVLSRTAWLAWGLVAVLAILVIKRL